MEAHNKYTSIDRWLELPREEQLTSLFACPPDCRGRQAKYLWGNEAYGYDYHVGIPAGVAWDEMAKVVISGNCVCSFPMKMKREYISQINRDEYCQLVEQENKLNELCYTSPNEADRDFYAFRSWRNENFPEGKEYIFTVEKYDDNTLLFLLCIGRGSYGDEDGFGVEPDLWTSALFDLKGNIVELFRPGIF